MIEFRNVSAGIGKKSILSALSAKLPNGKIYGVCAPRESSSIFLSLLASSSLPASGSVRINGFDTSDGTSAALCVGFLPSSGIPFPSLSASEFFRFLFSAKNVSYERSVRKTKELFDLLGFSPEEQKLPLRLFSPSDLLRVGIVSTLIGDSEVLIFEEPFRSLPAEEFDSITGLIRTAASGKTVFLSSPDASVLSSFCDEILVLSGGKIAELRTCARFSDSEDVPTDGSAAGKEE